MTGLSDGTIIDDPAKRGVLPSSRTSKAFGERSSGCYVRKTAHKSVGIVSELYLLLFFFFLNIFEGQLKESQTHIIVWHLSVWEEIIGDLQDIFISGSSCRIMFCDGINIYFPLPDKNILQRLQQSRGKLIGICKTNNPARRYHFDFNKNNTVNDHSTAIHRKNDEEIAALEALNGCYSAHGIRKPWTKSYRNQQQLYAWMGEP